MRNQDKFRGCLIGGAAGDALGYEVEFKKEQFIFSHYGERGITEYALHGGKALISDDTQMTLFTATGLLVETTNRIIDDEINNYYVEIRNSYLDWLKTQHERTRYWHGRCSSWLVNVPELFSLRDPGGTCLDALENGGQGTIGKPVNQSKGCGGVMRVAPIGLYFNNRYFTDEQIARIGADAAAITHGHILGWLPAAALVQIIHEISQNDASVYDAVMKTLQTQEEMWPASHHKDAFLNLMRKAVDLAGTSTNDLEAIHQLGEGWVAEETLAIAVYCALKYNDDFEKAVVAAVNHKGDSDSTGAVCGNIIGAKLGLKGIPEKFITNLELKDLILEIADDLYNDCPLNRYDIYNGDPVWISKYIDVTWSGPKADDPEPEPTPEKEPDRSDKGTWKAGDLMIDKLVYKGVEIDDMSPKEFVKMTPEEKEAYISRKKEQAKAPKRSGFDCPVYGVIEKYPEGTILKRDKDWVITPLSPEEYAKEPKTPVQAFVANISFPQSLDELWYDYMEDKGQYDLETVLYEEPGAWTAPKWAKEGDIVFFMHAAYAHQKINACRAELRKDNTYPELFTII